MLKLAVRKKTAKLSKVKFTCFIYVTVTITRKILWILLWVLSGTRNMAQNVETFSGG
jgi:hypothetical protein